MSKTDCVDEPIVPRPPQLAVALRLANEALQELEAAIDATEKDSDLIVQLSDAADDLESAIGYMAAVPEVEYLGQHVHGSES